MRAPRRLLLAGAVAWAATAQPRAATAQVFPEIPTAPPLAREAATHLREGDRLSARARALEMPRRRWTHADVEQWVTDHLRLLDASAAEYRAAYEVAEHAEPSWVEVSPGVYVYGALQVGLLSARLVSEFRSIAKAFARQQGVSTARDCGLRQSYFCNDSVEEILAPYRTRAIGAFQGCVERARAHAYWDANATECEQQLGSLDRSRHPIDELMPVPTWTSSIARERFAPAPQP